MTTYKVTEQDMTQALKTCLWAFGQQDAASRSLAIDQCLFCLGEHAERPTKSEKMLEALRFAASHIKSAEKWTVQCEEIIQSQLND